jgi:IMP dehydrogenase
MRVVDLMTTDVVTVQPDASLKEVARLLSERRVSGLPVVDEDGTLIGIVTNRDLRFVPVAEWATTHVADVMTPMPLVTAPLGISRDEATRILRQHKRERLPIVDEQGRLAGLITVKDFVRSEQYPARRRTARDGCSWVPRSATSATRGSGRRRSSRPASTCSCRTSRTATRA